MDIHNQSLLYRNNCRTYWTQLVRTGSQPSRHTLWVSGVGDLEAEPAPAPGLPATPLLPRPSKRSRFRPERTKSGWPKMSRAAHAPPGRPCLAPRSTGPVRPAPAGSPIPQAAALSHWGLEGSHRTRPAHSQAASHSPPASAFSTRSQHPPSFSATAPVQGQTACPLARRSSRARAYAQTATGHGCQKTHPDSYQGFARWSTCFDPLPFLAQP